MKPIGPGARPTGDDPGKRTIVIPGEDKSPTRMKLKAFIRSDKHELSRGGSTLFSPKSFSFPSSPTAAKCSLAFGFTAISVSVKTTVDVDSENSRLGNGGVAARRNGGHFLWGFRGATADEG